MQVPRNLVIPANAVEKITGGSGSIVTRLESYLGQLMRFEAQPIHFCSSMQYRLFKVRKNIVPPEMAGDAKDSS